MRVEDLLFIVGAQFATGGVLLAHLGTDQFGQFAAKLHAIVMLLAGGVLLVGAMASWGLSDFENEVLSQ